MRVPASHTRLLIITLLAAVAAGGCKSRGDDISAVKGSPEFIYQESRKALKSNDYQAAIQRLEALEARYPFSEGAKQGQLDLLYAYYKNRETESAIDQADQFIRENPTHPRVDYAYYIRGLVYFEGGANFLERSFKADISKRPPQDARSSFQSFQTLVQNYPKSPYAADARQRMVYLRNRLAEYEIRVARYYMQRGAYVGAANRARSVVETYDGAPAVIEALEIMATAYRELGMDRLAEQTDAVRQANLSPDLANPTAAMAGLVVSQAPGESGTAAAARGGAALRGGRWEARVGAASSLSTDLDFKGGTAVAVDSSTGFSAGAAYHFTDRLQAGATLSWDSKDYDAQVVGETPGESFDASGSLDTTSLMFDATYNIFDRPLTPFVTGAVGWSWVDTNIINAPPDIACWWDPWYGYVCLGSTNTKTLDGFAYELGVGLRYDFSKAFVVDGVYRRRWVSFDNARGTPGFDGLQLNLGWKF